MLLNLRNVLLYRSHVLLRRRHVLLRRRSRDWNIGGRNGLHCVLGRCVGCRCRSGCRCRCRCSLFALRSNVSGMAA